MKRSVDCNIWNEEWFINLSATHKCLWRLINDTCDYMGIWTASFRMASYAIGYELSHSDMVVFGNRVHLIGDGLYFISDFIRVQYGVLSPDCRPHRAIISRLRSYGIDVFAIDGVAVIGEEKQKNQAVREVANINEVNSGLNSEVKDANVTNNVEPTIELVELIEVLKLNDDTDGVRRTGIAEEKNVGNSENDNNTNIYDNPHTETDNDILPALQHDDKKIMQMNPVMQTTKPKRPKKTKEYERMIYFEDSDLNNLFNDFLQERRLWGKPATERATRMLVNTLNKISSGNKDYAMTIIERSIKSRWLDLYPLRQNETKLPHDKLAQFLNASDPLTNDYN